MAQWIKPLFVILALYIEAVVGVLATLLSIWLSVSVPGSTVGDDPSAWVPVPIEIPRWSTSLLA